MNLTGNFVALSTLGTVGLLPPLQDSGYAYDGNAETPGALRGPPLTFGGLRRLLLSTRYSKVPRNVELH